MHFALLLGVFWSLLEDLVVLQKTRLLFLLFWKTYTIFKFGNLNFLIGSGVLMRLN
jgi:hypothetical protein